MGAEAVLTEALGLEQVGLLHANVAAPGQEVGGVVAGEEGTRRGVTFARHLPRGEQLNGGRKISVSRGNMGWKKN